MEPTASMQAIAARSINSCKAGTILSGGMALTAREVFAACQEYGKAQSAANASANYFLSIFCDEYHIMLALSTHMGETLRVFHTLLFLLIGAFPGGGAYLTKRHAGRAKPSGIARPEAVDLACTKQSLTGMKEVYEERPHQVR
jgi:hypothetical protein